MFKQQIVQILKNNKYFGYANVVEHLKETFTDKVPLCNINNAGDLEINPKTFMSLNVKQKTFAVMHEVCHLLFDHFRYASSGIDKQTLNIACDVVINNLLNRGRIIDINLLEPIAGIATIDNTIYYNEQTRKIAANVFSDFYGSYFTEDTNFNNYINSPVMINFIQEANHKNLDPNFVMSNVQKDINKKQEEERQSKQNEKDNSNQYKEDEDSENVKSDSESEKSDIDPSVQKDNNDYNKECGNQDNSEYNDCDEGLDTNSDKEQDDYSEGNQDKNSQDKNNGSKGKDTKSKEKGNYGDDPEDDYDESDSSENGLDGDNRNTDSSNIDMPNCLGDEYVSQEDKSRIMQQAKQWFNEGLQNKKDVSRCRLEAMQQDLNYMAQRSQNKQVMEQFFNTKDCLKAFETINWTTIVKQAVLQSSVMKKDYTFAHPNRRNLILQQVSKTKAQLPNNYESRPVPNLHVFVDTSGSVSDFELGCVLNEIKNLFNSCNRCNIKVTYFNDTLGRTNQYRLGQKFDIDSFGIARGGTSFSIIWDLFYNAKGDKIGTHPDICVIITDGVPNQGRYDYSYGGKMIGKQTIWVTNQKGFKAPNPNMKVVYRQF